MAFEHLIQWELLLDFENKVDPDTIANLWNKKCTVVLQYISNIWKLSSKFLNFIPLYIRSCQAGAHVEYFLGNLTRIDGQLTVA